MSKVKITIYSEVRIEFVMDVTNSDIDFLAKLKLAALKAANESPEYCVPEIDFEIINS